MHVRARGLLRLRRRKETYSRRKGSRGALFTSDVRNRKVDVRARGLLCSRRRKETYGRRKDSRAALLTKEVMAT